MKNLENLIDELKNEEKQRRLAQWQDDEAYRKLVEADKKLGEILDSQPTTYPQDWPAYNEAQRQEKLILLDILSELCSTLPESKKKVGRPRTRFGDVVFACISKVYECMSGRRANSDLTLAYRMGYVTSIPSVTTMFDYFRDPELTPFLYKLVEMSALPLKDLEETLIVDASGLSNAFYSRWFDHRYVEKQHASWNKIHVIVGRASQIVIAIKVTDEHGADCPQFPALLEQALRNFKPRGVCGDKAYLSKENLKLIWEAGAIPLIPFKSNSRGRRSKSLAWRKMFYEYHAHQERFMRQYHQRSLVESSFSALKRKFQGRLMMRSEAGKVNEALAKVLCYNICVLIHEAKKNKIKLDFFDSERKSDLPNEN